MRIAVILISLFCVGTSTAVSLHLWHEIEALDSRPATPSSAVLTSTGAPAPVVAVTEPEKAPTLPVPRASEPSKATEKTPLPSCNDLKRQSPEWRAAIRAYDHAMYMMQMPNLSEDLHISQSQVDKLFELISDQQVRMGDVLLRSGVAVAGTEQAIQEQKRIMDENKRQSDVEIAQLLGEEKATAFREYQDGAPIRKQVDRLQNALAGTTNALTADQIRSLVTDFEGDRRAFANADGRMQRIHGIAAAYLSPAQLATFDALEQADAQRGYAR